MKMTKFYTEYEYTNKNGIKYLIKMRHAGSIEITRLSDKQVILFAQKGWDLALAQKFLDI